MRSVRVILRHAMRARLVTILIAGIVTSACRRERPCGDLLEYDAVRNVCVCPDEGEWDHDAGRCTTDAGTSDAGSSGCDPLEATACGGTGRCTWVQRSTEAGETECVPDGSVASNGACAVGEAGYDDCARGLVCMGSRCRPICRVRRHGGRGGREPFRV